MGTRKKEGMRGKEGIRCGSGGASPSSLMIVAAAPWYLVSVEPSQCYFLLLLQLSMPLLPTSSSQVYFSFTDKVKI
jgi:hypothetical protein